MIIENVATFFCVYEKVSKSISNLILRIVSKNEDKTNIMRINYDPELCMFKLEKQCPNGYIIDYQDSLQNFSIGYITLDYFSLYFE